MSDQDLEIGTTLTGADAVVAGVQRVKTALDGVERTAEARRAVVRTRTREEIEWSNAIAAVREREARREQQAVEVARRAEVQATQRAQQAQMAAQQAQIAATNSTIQFTQRIAGAASAVQSLSGQLGVGELQHVLRCDGEHAIEAGAVEALDEEMPRIHLGEGLPDQPLNEAHRPAAKELLPGAELAPVCTLPIGVIVSIGQVLVASRAGVRVPVILERDRERGALAQVFTERDHGGRIADALDARRLYLDIERTMR